jgi:hypothetical protein
VHLFLPILEEGREGADMVNYSIHARLWVCLFQHSVTFFLGGGLSQVQQLCGSDVKLGLLPVHSLGMTCSDNANFLLSSTLGSIKRQEVS